MTTPRQRITPKKGEQTRTLRKRQQCIDKRISPATILDLIPTTTKTNYSLNSRQPEHINTVNSRRVDSYYNRF